MEKIKYLILLLVGFSLLFSACNHENTMIYHTLPIEKEYEPVIFIYDRSEISNEELKEMPNLKLVINSEDEFPENDLMGLEELKESNIDFRKYTLLLFYYKLPGIVIDYTPNYAKDFEKNILIFSLTFHLDENFLNESETKNPSTYFGYAILVSKIQMDEEVVFRLSY